MNYELGAFMAVKESDVNRATSHDPTEQTWLVHRKTGQIFMPVDYQNGIYVARPVSRMPETKRHAIKITASCIQLGGGDYNSAIEQNRNLQPWISVNSPAEARKHKEGQLYQRDAVESHRARLLRGDQ